jgi:Tol biopolymer transport system component
VSTRNGGVQVLKSTNWHDDANAFVSPNGRFIAFDQPGPKATARDIFVLALDGSREIPAIVHSADDRLVGWSPDGQRLLFVSDRTGSPGLWSLPFQADSRPGSPELVRRDIGRFNWSLGITSSGSLLLYSRAPAASNSVTDIKEASVDFATGRVLSAPAVTVHQFVGSNTSPTWSPDGRFLVWVSKRGTPPAPSRVYLVVRSLDDDTTREWPVNLTFQGAPQWAPDSRSLIVLGDDRDQRHGIYRIDRETGATTVVTVAGPFRSDRGLRRLSAEQSWSIDGSRFYYLRDAPTARAGTLVEHELSTGAERELFTGPSGDLSADGQTLYYLRDVPNGRQSSYESRLPNGTLTTPVVRESAIVARALSSGVERELARRLIVSGLFMSPDRQQFALTSHDPATGSWSVGTVGIGDGTYREVMRWNRVRPPAVVAWSRDSRSLVVTTPLTNAIGGPVEHWWAPLSGREARRIPEFGSGSLASLQMHPDGRRLVFVAQSGARAWPEVRVIDGVVPSPSAAPR